MWLPLLQEILRYSKSAGENFLRCAALRCAAEPARAPARKFPRAAANTGQYCTTVQYLYPVCGKDFMYPKMEKEMDHAFLSHNWGLGDIPVNHVKVSRINRRLKELGLNTWFDDDRLSGNIRQGLVDAISKANCFVAFVTKLYELKINSGHPLDSCYYEFNYASSNRKITSLKMVAVILDEEMKDSSTWSGRLFAELGSSLRVDLSGAFEPDGYDVTNESYFQAQCAKVIDVINKVVSNDYSHIQEITDGSNRYHDRKYPWIKPFFEGIEDTYEDIISRKFDQLINIISIEPGLNDELVTYNYDKILIQILKLPNPATVLKSFLNLLAEGRNDLVSKILQSITDRFVDVTDEISLKTLKTVIYQCDIHKLMTFLFNKHFMKAEIVDLELSTLLVRFTHHMVRTDAKESDSTDITRIYHDRPLSFLQNDTIEYHHSPPSWSQSAAEEAAARKAIVSSIMENHKGSYIIKKCYLDRYFTCFSNNLQGLMDMNTLRIPELLQLCTPEELKATKYYNMLKLSELKAWYSCSDLYEIFSLQELKDAGFCVTQLKDSGIFTPLELKDVGFTARDFLESRRFSLRDLKDKLGFSLVELKQGGVTDPELEKAQFALEVFLSYPEMSFNLFKAGFELSEVMALNKGKQSIAILKGAGYPPTILFHAGFTVRELYLDAKFSIEEIFNSVRHSRLPLYAILENKGSIQQLRSYINHEQFLEFLHTNRTVFQPLLELNIPLPNLTQNFHPIYFKENNISCTF
jgi:hypothetical protein